MLGFGQLEIGTGGGGTVSGTRCSIIQYLSSLRPDYVGPPCDLPSDTDTAGTIYANLNPSLPQHPTVLPCPGYSGQWPLPPGVQPYCPYGTWQQYYAAQFAQSGQAVGGGGGGTYLGQPVIVQVAGGATSAGQAGGSDSLGALLILGLALVLLS